MAGRRFQPAPPPPPPHHYPPPHHFREPPRHPPPHHMPPVYSLEDRLAAEFEDAHVLLAENQRLAAPQVALVQEVEAARHELARASRAAGSSHDDADARLRELQEKSMKLEKELRAVDEQKAELAQVREDIRNLSMVRQDLMGQVNHLFGDLTRSSTDVQQIHTIKAEIDFAKNETQRMRANIELEKKGYAENYEKGKEMEKNLISMAREVEKLRAEVANADKIRAQTIPSAGNQSYFPNYGNLEPGYMPGSYNMSQAGFVAGSHYGQGTGQASWGAFDMQHTQGRK